MITSRAPKFQVLTITLVVLTALAAIGYVLRQQEQLKANRLKNAQSAYLRLSMHQLVDWLEWSQEAFTRARELRKPIFLDMGASWSHDCVVMGRENYDDPDIADILNQQFVPVKVDIDARPELLRRYEIERNLKFPQRSKPLPQLMALSPDGDVIYALHPESKNRFHDALNRIVEELNAKRERVFEEATKQRSQVDAAIRPIPGSATQALIDGRSASLEQAFDTANGGFRGDEVGKRLRPAALEFLLARYGRTADQGARMMVVQTLDTMARSAIYDHLRGGFYHATSDDKWEQPEFGKLCSENAQMLRVYSIAYHVFRNPLYKEVAYGIADYMSQNLTDPVSGAFWSSQAADINRWDDGSYYTWTLDQADELLDDREMEAARRYFGIPRENAAGANRYALRVTRSLAQLAHELGVDEPVASELIRSAKEKMLRSRPLKKRPPIDKTVYAHLNGIAIHGFIAAYRVFQDPRFRDMAVNAMNTLRSEFLTADDAVYHMKGPNQMMATGWLDDQIWTVRAALDVYQLTAEPALLHLAEKLMSHAIELHANSAGGFYDLPNVNSPAGVVLRLHQAVKDYPLPASNAIVANALDDLCAYTGNLRWAAAARAALDSVAGTASQLGIEACAYARSVQRHIAPPFHAVVVGNPQDTAAQEMLAFALSQNPLKVSVALIAPKDAPKCYRPVNGKATAYLCHGRQRSEPITSLDGLRAAIQKPIGGSRDAVDGQWDAGL